MRRVVLQPPRVASRLVALAWAVLACALVAEFGGVSRKPQCRDAGQAPPPAAAPAGAPTNSTANSTTAAGPTWQEVDALITKAPARFGRQEKFIGGVPANLTLLLVHMTNKNANLHGVPAGIGPGLFRWFAHAFTFNKTVGQSNRELQSPVPACHFYVDHRYRILYVRNTKTAGTSISNTLGMKENPMTCEKDPVYCYAKCKGKHVCMEYLWDQDKLKQAFSEYTVFAFVRNPWARAISSWLHIHKFGFRDGCKEPFAKFAEVPSGYGAKCLAHKGACCRKRFGWILEHIEPQARCLFTAEGRPVVDFIGRVEHADEDMQSLLGLINSRRPMGTEELKAPALPRLMVGSDSLSGKAESRRRAYAELYLNNTALADVRSYFYRDFALLQYDSRIPWEDVGSSMTSSLLGSHIGVLGSSTSSLADVAGGDGGGGLAGGSGQQAQQQQTQQQQQQQQQQQPGFPDPRDMALKESTAAS